MLLMPAGIQRLQIGAKNWVPATSASWNSSRSGNSSKILLVTCLTKRLVILWAESTITSCDCKREVEKQTNKQIKKKDQKKKKNQKKKQLPSQEIRLEVGHGKLRTQNTAFKLALEAVFSATSVTDAMSAQVHSNLRLRPALRSLHMEATWLEFA